MGACVRVGGGAYPRASCEYLCVCVCVCVCLNARESRGQRIDQKTLQSLWLLVQFRLTKNPLDHKKYLQSSPNGLTSGMFRVCPTSLRVIAGPTCVSLAHMFGLLSP